MQTWKRAQNMQIATREEGAIIGQLNDFQFDLMTHAVFGWRIKGAGVFSRAGGVSSADVLMIGRDIAFVRSERSVEWTGAGRNQAPGRAWASDYRGTSVVDQRGRSMGAVQDFVIDEQGATVTGLILHGNLLLPLDESVRTGPAAVVAHDASLAVPVPDPDGDKDDWWSWVKDAIRRRDEAPRQIGADEVSMGEEVLDDPTTWPPPEAVVLAEE